MYTKGEWEVFRFSTYHNWKVKTGDDNWFVDCGVDENSEANAHLIAAAPDMHKALRAILGDQNSALAREKGWKALAKADKEVR